MGLGGGDGEHWEKTFPGIEARGAAVQWGRLHSGLQALAAKKAVLRQQAFEGRLVNLTSQVGALRRENAALRTGTKPKSSLSFLLLLFI